jgi:hypothetical protein
VGEGAERRSREAGEGGFARQRSESAFAIADIPLTRLELALLILATLSHKRAFTPVFDGLRGEGENPRH